ncbi:hypothetical protein K439DRAFT_1611762 [Ramaria rubella]|nr:hypothetical protein K439DRAFT_1611762 [Ramaria rubella]
MYLQTIQVLHETSWKQKTIRDMCGCTPPKQLCHMDLDIVPDIVPASNAPLAVAGSLVGQGGNTDTIHDVKMTDAVAQEAPTSNDKLLPSHDIQLAGTDRNSVLRIPVPDEVRWLLGQFGASRTSKRQPKKTKAYRQQISTLSHAAGVKTTVAKNGRAGKTVAELKEECKKSRLPVGGKKCDLVLRLKVHKTAESRKTQVDAVRAEGHPVDELEPTALEAVIVDSTAQKEADKLGESFLRGLNDITIVEEEDGTDSDEEEVLVVGAGDNPIVSADLDDITARKVGESFAWVDQYILESRREGARKTERSLLLMWNCWLRHQLAAGVLPDNIIDTHHIIEYLKYAATRKLFAPNGRQLETNQRLSASSLKKIMVMLGRVRRCQEEDNLNLTLSRPAHTSRTKDFLKSVMVEAQRLQMDDDNFDVAKNTILDYSLFPEQFRQIEHAIFHLNQLPSIIKSHFAWNWQCATIIRGDELISLPMSCLQPHQIHIPDYLTPDGRRSGTGKWCTGVLSLYYESKVKKPGHLLERLPDWDWTRASTWRKHKLMFGRKVEEPLKSGGMLGMYTTFLRGTSIKSDKKQHLARRSVPTKIGEMGVPTDDIDAIGDWQGNTRHEVYSLKIPKAGITVLAGFYVGENYNVPWTAVEVPLGLQARIFAFAEAALANIKCTPTPNQGTVNFLELLIYLRPFLWRLAASLYQVYPNCPVFTWIASLNPKADRDVQTWYHVWPKLREAKEAEMCEAISQAAGFTESATQSAFIAISRHQQDLREQLEEQDLQPQVQSHISSSPASSPLYPLVEPQSPQTPWSIQHPGDSVEAQQVPNITLSLQPTSGTSGLNSQLVPRQVSHAQVRYTVLPLSPGPTAPCTPHDYILPSPAAFSGSSTIGVEPHYPKFGRLCTWQTLLELICDPYGRGTVGAQIHLVEGALVDGVGQKAPLQMVERQWGAKKNLVTKKGHQQTWRPTSDTNVRKKWHQFMAIVNRIQAKIDKGKSSTDAVAALDALCGNDSLPKFFVDKVQEKKGSRKGCNGVAADVPIIAGP